MRKKYRFALILAAIPASVNLIYGCSAAEKKSSPRQECMLAHLRLETIKESIENNRIRPGMKDKELAALIGKPDNTVKIKTDGNSDEQWIYEDKTQVPEKYISFHFRGGKLIDW